MSDRQQPIAEESESLDGDAAAGRMGDVKVPDVFKAIASNGDVIFEVEGDEGEMYRLLVSSAILMTVSKVFAASPGPHFREGNEARSSANPATICLKDDDADAMSDLFQLLHLQSVPELEYDAENRSSLNRVYCLAIVADKYRCTEILRLPVQALLQNQMDDRVPLFAMIEIAASAYLCDQPRIFGTVTGSLIRE